MGREIETKIPLSKAQFDFYYERLFLSTAENLSQEFFTDINIISATGELTVKKDEYFTKYKSLEESRAKGEPQVIRLRTEEDSNGLRAFFTIKRKTLQNGIEVNKEDESFVENPEVMRDFIELAGYHCWFKKEKKAYSAHCELNSIPGLDFHVEMEIVNDLPYIEVEVTDESKEPDEVKAALSQFIINLGLDPNDKDSRSWVQIINESN